jgi:hypothetical protein
VLSPLATSSLRQELIPGDEDDDLYPALAVAPWDLVDDEDWDYYIAGCDAHPVAAVHDERPDAAAVARAICALPELLVAADAALAALVDACSDHPTWRGLKAAREQLERALARARHTAPGRSED